MLLLVKILTQIAYPLLTSLLLAILANVLLWRGQQRWGISLLTIALSWLWLWSTPVFSDWLRASLEQRIPPVPLKQIPSADIIVVLGGAMQSPKPPDRLYPNLKATADRIWYTARLYHAGKAPLILASGGYLPWGGVTQPEATVISQLLQQFGVPATAILLETESRTTHENCVYSLPILKKINSQRILLVTSALHMPRALALFQKSDFEIIPAPTDFEIVARNNFHPLRWLPDARALASSSRALKEYLGKLLYQITRIRC